MHKRFCITLNLSGLRIILSKISYKQKNIINSLELVNNHTYSPYVIVSFDKIANINKYSIMRRENKGTYINLGEST